MKKLLVILTVTLLATFTVSTVWAQPYSDALVNDDFDSTPDGIPTPADDNDNLDGDPEGTEGTDYSDINDAINFLLGTNYANNEDVDFLQYTDPNDSWQDISGEDSTGTFMAISLTASFSNTLGIYSLADGETEDLLGAYSGFGYLGQGTDSDPFPAAVSTILTTGENFGFYLNSSGGNTWDSNPAANSDGYDHMLVYQLEALAGKEIVINTSCTGLGTEADPIVCNEKENETYVFSDPYLIAWEDIACVDGVCGDEDYDDMIFLVDRVKPVPEPMTMVLLGSGLAGLAAVRRKRS